MTTTLLRRAVGVLGTVAIAAGALVAVATPANAAFNSSIGGYVARSEVIERAQYWVDHQPGSYSQVSYSLGANGDRSYRRDCSGYVDMSFHLGSDPNTDSLGSITSVINRNDLKAGDIMLYVNPSGDGHTFLFDGWEGDHVHFSYYSFGSAPVRHVLHADITASTLDGHPNSVYQSRRYNKIIDDAPPAVVNMSNGATVMFKTDPNGDLKGSTQSSSTASFSPWQYLTNGMIGAPSAVELPNGTLAVFGRSMATGAIWVGQQGTPGGSYSWTTIGGSGGMTSDPTAVVSASGAISVYAISQVASGGHVWVSAQSTAGGAYGAWTDLGNGYVGRPAAIRLPNGGNAVATRSFSTGGVWVSAQSGPGSGYSVGVQVGGSGGMVSDPTLAVSAAGALSVFATSGGTQLWVSNQAGGGWGTWTQLGTGYVGQPTAVRQVSGAYTLFARSYATGALWTIAQNSAGGSFSESSLGGNMTADNTAVIASSGAISVFGVGTDGNYYRNKQAVAGGGFGGWGQVVGAA